MRQKISWKCFITAFFLLAAMPMVSISALAQSSWQWHESLQVDLVGQSMYMPSAIAFEEDSQRYYVVDTGLNRLVSFSRDGELLRAFTANDRLKSPFDMVRLDNGQLWVVEKGRNSLTLIDVAARKVEPHTLTDGGKLIFPDRIAVAQGRLFVLDRASGQILRLADDLSVEQRYGCTDCAAGMIDFVIEDNQVIALEPRDKKIYRFNKDGTIADEIALKGKVDFPVSLDVGPSGFFYVLDRHQGSVLVFSQNGQFRYSFLDSGQSAGKVYFARQVRFDPWGRLCVVDEGNGRVEIFSR